MIWWHLRCAHDCVTYVLLVFSLYRVIECIVKLFRLVRFGLGGGYLPYRFSGRDFGAKIQNSKNFRLSLIDKGDKGDWWNRDSTNHMCCALSLDLRVLSFNVRGERKKRSLFTPWNTFDNTVERERQERKLQNYMHIEVPIKSSATGHIITEWHRLHNQVEHSPAQRLLVYPKALTHSLSLVQDIYWPLCAWAVFVV